MRLVLIAMTLSAVVCVLPTQAAPNSTTRSWEKKFFPAVQSAMCAPQGSMVKLFKITPASCRRTYRYAARHCRRAAHAVPFYRVMDRSTGTGWGKWLGSCIGSAFDMKHTYKQKIP